MSELKGRLSKIGDVESIVLRNGGELKKRTIVLDYLSGTIEKKAAFVVQVDSVNAEINHYRLGDDVTVFYNIESREWNSKWFTDLKVWRISGVGSGSNSGTTNNTTKDVTNSAQAATTASAGVSPAAAARQQSDAHPANQEGYLDDLPF